MKTKLSYIMSMLMLLLALSSSQCDSEPDLEGIGSSTTKELKEGEQAKSGRRFPDNCFDSQGNHSCKNCNLLRDERHCSFI